MRTGHESRPEQELQHARELLAGANALEILARIVPEDALGLHARIGSRLGAGALLCDGARALLLAQALCAARASAAPEAAGLARWLDQQVEEALALLAGGDWSEREPGAALAALASPLALDAESLVEGCARFNRLPFELREAFFALVLDGASPDHVARARGLSLSELVRRARAALESFREPRERGVPWATTS